MTPWIVACTKLLRPWDFQGKSTGVGCHLLLQGIFPTQGSNPGLSHCRQMFYRLSKGQDIFKLLKGKNLQPGLLYLVRISLKIDGEIKSFSDKQKLREFSTTKLALQQMLRGLYSQEIKEKKKDLQNQLQAIQKKAIGTYISIVT